MNDFHTKNALFSLRQLKRRKPTGGRAGGLHLLALLSLAACGSGDDSPATDALPTTIDSAPIANNTLDDALIYITLEGSLADVDNPELIDLSRFVILGEDGISPINLGDLDLDASEVSIVTDSEGNQVLTISRAAVINRSGSDTLSSGNMLPQDTPFVGDGSVVTITDGSAEVDSVVELPLSGGDGKITYALEGATDFSIEQGQLSFRADSSGTYTLVATDADGDTASITIDYTIPPIAAQTHKGNDGDVEVDLTAVLADNSDLTLTSGDGIIANNTLTIDTENLEDGEHTITVTATDSSGEEDIVTFDTFVLTVDKSPTVATALQDATVVGNDTIIDLDGVFDNGSGTLALTSSLGNIGADNSLTLSDSVFTEGTHTITITATDTNGDMAEDVVELISDKSPTIAASISDDIRATNHSNTTIDLTTVFANGSGTTNYAVTAPAGASLADSDLTIDYSTLGVGTHTVTVTATDGDAQNADSVTDEFVLTVVKLNGNKLGSQATLTGTTFGDAITGNSFLTSTTYTDASTGRLISRPSYITNVDVDGGDGDDTINNNTMEYITDIRGVTFDGGDGNDTINSNYFRVFSFLSVVDFVGGAGDDTINNNTLRGGWDVRFITFDGGAGDDTISHNTLRGGWNVRNIDFDGGDGNDTISNNTFRAAGLTLKGWDVKNITLHGGEGNDTISDNHFESGGKQSYYDVYAISLMGGAGDDVFRDNTATQANGESASLTIDGGDGEDTVVFRLNADQYIGAVAWAHGETITISGDGAAVTLIDIETLSFADGTVYYASDAVIEGNGGTTIDLVDVFAEDVTGYTVSIGTVGDDNSLTLAGNDLQDGVNTVTITATDTDGNAVTMDITINADKSPTVKATIANKTLADGNDGTAIDVSGVFGHPVDGEVLALSSSAGTIIDGTLTLLGADLADGANTITLIATDEDSNTPDSVTSTFVITTDKAPTIAASISDDLRATNHSNTTIDLTTVFDNGSGTLTYAVTAPNGVGGVSTDNSALTIDYSTLGAGTHTIIVTATDSDAQNADSVTDEFVLTVIKLNDNSLGSNATLTGTTYADAITDNSFSASTLTNADLDGGAGNDTISNNTLTGADVDFITFDGGAGDDTISSNALTAGSSLKSASYITFDGGAGDDTISSNTVTAGRAVWSITFAGDDGNDTISSNTLTAGGKVHRITFDGGAGDDTISNNILTTGGFVRTINFDGGAGNDTISDNHFESTSTQLDFDVYDITLMGGAGDDVFRDNTATQANGESASLNIDGGDGEDTVVFRSIAGEYAGLSNWLNFSDGGVTTITLTGDGAAVTLIDVETISFADGAIYSAADAWVEGKGGVLYDLANAFAGTFTAYNTDRGTITDSTLALAGTELAHGANTIVITATASDSDSTETTETITVNVVRDLGIPGAKQHNEQTFDLGDVFVETTTTTYTALTLPEGVTLSSGNLSFDNTILSESAHPITITATDGSDAVTYTLIYTLDTIKDQTFSDGGSNTTYTGTTLADAITGNSFADTSSTLSFVDLDGGAGDDTISSNTLTARDNVRNINFNGDDGDDTISNNTLTAKHVKTISFNGGDGDDTISNNTLNAVFLIYSITFDGGEGNDTISDNHFESSWNYTFGGVSSVILMGGAGDDVFRDNTATQANGASALMTIDGGDGADTVVFRLNADQYIGAAAWVHGETITISGDGAAVTLIDIETLSFADGTAYYAADAIIEGNGGTTIDLASVFAESVTSYTVSVGTVGSDNSLTLAGSDLQDGVSTLTVTATDSDGNAVIMDITINADKSPTIAASIYDDLRATNHSNTTIDLTTVFDNGSGTLTYAVTASNGVGGVSTDNSALTIDYSTLGAGTHTITVTATDSDAQNADSVTDEFVLTVIKLNDNSLGSNATLTGTTYADAITDNSFAVPSSILTFVDLDGGAGDDTISSNTLTAGDRIDSITFAGGDGDDTISNNTIRGDWFVRSITFDGGDGNDSISNNTLTASSGVRTITFDGGDGNDSISNNTLIAELDISSIIFAGGDGDDTISNNHFESTRYDVVAVTLMGGAGDDLFSNNTATQTNGLSVSLTIDGGDGEDNVVFRSVAGEYTGIADWIDGVTTITLNGDGAAVTLIDVETISFADGAIYSAADAWVQGNGGVLYDLANAFAGTFTAYNTDRGTITDSTLALAGTELGHGANTIVITATDTDNNVTTETITVNVVRDLEIFGAKQHNEQTFDLGDVFIETNTTTYTALTLPNGVTLSSGNLSFDNTILSESTHPITITATDGSDAATYTLIYALDTIKDQTFSDGGSNTTYTGTTLADAITGNSFADTSSTLSFVDLDGGAGDDTISSNTLTARDNVRNINFDGGDGNDTISDNHFESTGLWDKHDVYAITLMGGVGDDVFRDNTASQGNGESASMTIDGGVGEDTVVFRSIADEYAGLSDWVVGVTTITLTGDGDAVTLIDVEIISFADGASYRAADASVEGNAGILYDLANAFPDAETTFTAYNSDRGTITNNTLTLAGTELGHGANTIVITATANDNNVTTETITVNAVKTLKIAGAKQHAQQTIDIDTIFVDAYTYTYTSTPGISLSGSTFTFDNTNSALSEGNHSIVITATDDSDVFTHTLTYALDTIKDQSGDASFTTYTGTTLADAITSNSIAETSGYLNNVDLDGGAGNDSISNNTLTASHGMYSITFDGGAGDDTISSNTLTAGYRLYWTTFDGGDGNDTISNNTLSPDREVQSIIFDGGDGNDTISNNTLTGIIGRTITFDGGAGNDSISNNTLTADERVYSITFDGGAGDDTISDNHIESTGTHSSYDVVAVTLMGGAGDDVFSGNTATQANGELSSITIDGGADTDGLDTDEVHFDLASNLFTITGAYGSNITVTDNAARTEAADGIDSYAEYVLIDIEELYFSDSESKYEF